MTIGRSSRKGSVRRSIRAPKFLDKSSGFYCRLDEPNGRIGGEEKEEVGEAEESQNETAEALSQGEMGDDGETLLQRKASRRSSRWRRSSRRKRREAEGDPAGEQGSQEVVIRVAAVEEEEEEKEDESAGGHGEPAFVNFATREEADDRVLIRHMKRGRDGDGDRDRDGDEEEERRATREQEEGMKMVKRMAAKNYRKVSQRGTRTFRMGRFFPRAQIYTNSRLRSPG